MTTKLQKSILSVLLILSITACDSDNSNNAQSNNIPSTKTTLVTSQQTYAENEAIVVQFDNMSGDTHDWIGIFPEGVSNDWGNQLDWTWTEGNVKGEKQFKALPLGNYEVRAFFKNSFDVEAISSFKIDGQHNAGEAVTLTLNKQSYLQNELIYVNYKNMAGNTKDWIGVYPAGTNNDVENMIDFKFTTGNVNGEISLGGVDALPDTLNAPGGLKPGNYEVRAFFNNTFNVEKVASFKVVQQAVNSTVYEAANGVLSPNWYHISGPTAPFYADGMVNLTSNWINFTTNTSEYRLVFPEPNTTQKVLELDAGGLRYQKHFYIGVILETLHGPRKMIWDPFFNHEGVSAFKKDQYLSYPLYVDIQEESETRHHVRVDVEKYLRVLEPSNKVVSISAFMASGGDLDEIKLSSH